MPRIRVPLLFLSLAPLASAQDTPCPAATALPTPSSYRVEPISNGFTTIVGAAGTVPLVFAAVDDASATIPIGAFTFSFYGLAAATFNAATNGFATVGTASTAYQNRHPGDGSVPNNAMMVWHDDQVLSNAAASVSYNFGFFGPGTLAIEWHDMALYTIGPPTYAGTGSMNYQAILYASTHPLLPNAIEFRYDRTAGPPTQVPCAVATTGDSSFAPSATVGLDSVSATSTLNAGVDGTDRGGGNTNYPPTDLRFLPVVYSGTEQNYSATSALVPQEPFCHIEGLPGTVAVGAPCATVCNGDDVSAQTDGALIPLPWKFNLGGRNAKNAEMDSNGFVMLGQGTFASNATNTAAVTVADPDAVLAPFWDDLEGTAAGSGMFWRVDGTPGCRVVTFEWHAMSNALVPGGDCAGGGGLISFQVKLFEGSAGAISSVGGGCPYDTVVPGFGNDRIEYHYDHAGFVPGGFSASTAFENHKGTLGGFPVPGAFNVAPPTTAAVGAKVVIDWCDFGVVRYFGDPSETCAGSSCLPELKTNAVPPRIGNPFGLQMVGGSAGIPFLNLSLSAPLPGLATPVPCGGLPSPFGVFWAPLGSLFPGTPPTAGGPCGSGSTWATPIPFDPTLVGGAVFAQAANVVLVGGGFCVELTEGAKVVIGG